MSIQEPPASPAVPRMERRLAAILSAGVHDFSRLMSDDEEDTVRTLSVYRRTMTTLVSQHHGRVVDTPGENVMAEFGSTADAVQAAVAIQHELKARNAQLPAQRWMTFRIGINLGDVIVDGERLYGDGVNIAARVERIATGGEICISRSVYDQVRDSVSFQYHDIGERQVKNISKPVHVYRVEYQVDTIESDTDNKESGKEPAPIVGREVELETLETCLEAALRGERQIVFVTGESGIGKTTLVETFLQRLRQRTDTWIAQGQCVEQYGAGEAYLPVLEAFGRLGRQGKQAELVSLFRQYAPTWLVQLPALLEDSELEALQEQTHGSTQERLLREMAEALEILTADQGVVFVLEDLHWSDVSTVELLVSLARRRQDAKLLVIGTYRPADLLASDHPLKGTVKELQVRGQCLELCVSPLRTEAVQQYLNNRFTGAVFPAEMPHTIQRRTRGNSLFMTTIIEDLIQRGVLAKTDEYWSVQGELQIVEDEVPRNLQQMIERQVERLGESEQRFLEVASIAGVEFSTAAIAAALQTDEEGIEESCEQLVRRGQFLQAQGIEEWPDGTFGGRYSFLHALYQDVLSQRVGEARRIGLHKRIGERREAAYGEQSGEIAAELAVHFERGQVASKAIRYRYQAGENAMRRSAHREALLHLTNGIELLKSLPDSSERMQQELQFDITLGAARMALKGYGEEEAGQAYSRARELSEQLGDLRQHFRTLWGLWSFHYVRGELSTARALGEQCLRLAEQLHNPVRLMQAHEAVGASLLNLGEFAPAWTHLEEAIRLYDVLPRRPQATQHPGVECRAYLGLVLWFLGYPDQARECGREAVALAEELGHTLSLAFAQGWATWGHYFQRDWRAAEAQAEETIALSKEQEFPLWLANGMGLHGWALAQGGKGEEGFAQMQQAVIDYRATGVAMFYPTALSVLAEMHGKLGDQEAGLKRIAEALEVVKKQGEQSYEAELYRLKGELLLQQPEVQSSPVTPPVPQTEAEACFENALEIARRQRAKSLELRTAMSLGRLWQKQGKVEDARQVVEEIYSWFTEGFDTKDLQDAETLLKDLGSTVERPRQHRPERPAETVGRLFSQPLGIAPLLTETTQATSKESDPTETLSQPHRLAASELELVFRQEGEYWTVTFKRRTCRVKHSRGMQYLAQLLQRPEQEFHALALASGQASVEGGESVAPRSVEPPDSEQTAAAGIGDAGEMLDPQAKEAYRRRLKELQAELEEAQEFNDLGRVEQLQAELDFLTRELSQAVGLGGRTRKAASSSERARVNVTRAIRTAIKRVTEGHPACGEYLTQAIQTGTFCSYVPPASQ